MKRAICLLLLLCLLLSACSGASNTRSTRSRRDKDEDTSATAAPPVTAAPTTPEDPTNASEEDVTENNSSSVVVTEPPTEPPATEPPVTEPPATEPPATDPVTEPSSPGQDPGEQEQTNLLDAFSTSDWKRLNTFLSNFSELGFIGYDSADSTGKYDAWVAFYVLIHYKINDPSKLSYSGTYVKISQTNMDNCTKRFFGKTIARKDLAVYFHGYLATTVFYQNSTYFMENGEGESYNYLTIANRMVKTSSGTYLVSFDVYELDLEEYFDKGVDSSYYSLTSQQAAKKGSLTYQYSGEAEIRDYTSGSLISYQLLRYVTPLVTEYD